MSVINVNKFIDDSKFTRFHLIIFTLFLSIISFDGFDMVIYGATMPVLMKNFGINAAQAGVLASYALFGAAVGALTFGLLADRIGRKKVIIICALLFSLATSATGLTNSSSMFGVLRFLTGLGLGGVMPNVVALTTEYAPRKNRAIVVAAIFSGMQIGGILASAISMWLLPHYGWRVIYFLGGIPLLLMPAFFKYLPESTLHLIKENRAGELKVILQNIQKDMVLPDDVTFDINKGTGKSPIAALFTENRALSTVLIWVVFFMNMYMIFGLGTWLPKLMMSAGFGLGSGLLFLLTLNLGALLGSNIAGLVADRIGYKVTLVVLYLIAFVAIMLMSISSSFAVQIALVALAGIGFYGGQNVLNAYVGLFYPPIMRSTAMGFAFGTGRFGAIFGPVIAGIIMSMKMPLFVNFMALAVPGLIAAVAILIVQDKHSFLQKSKSKQETM
ncbi:MFS transporter [Clostridium thailandense]|uniref:MFS transporter n=1 Tax=Clostridium thailandense TaxID=2794346 RepID=UPI003988D683